MGGEQAPVQAGTISVSMARNSAFKYMKLSLSGSDDFPWFGVGFGSRSMSGTYAILSTDSSTSGLMERTLATHSAGTEVSSNSWSYDDGEVSIEVADGTRLITIYRPYAPSDDVYDFTEFMDATASSLDVISAIGLSDTLSEGHSITSDGGDVTITDNRGSGTFYTSCSEVGGSTPSPVTPGDGSGSGANAISCMVALLAGVAAYIAA